MVNIADSVNSSRSLAMQEARTRAEATEQSRHNTKTKSFIRQKIEWRDLTNLSKTEITQELAITLPWLIASLTLAYFEHYWLALPCSFMVFLTGLRKVHDIFHGNLTLSKSSNNIVLFMMSQLMLGSMHAVKWNHLRHHRYCLQPDDIEGASAKEPAWKAILLGPIFPYKLHKKALKEANRSDRLWIKLELFTNIAILILVWGFLNSDMLKFHYATMIVGQCLTAFFAVWTVHHDCEDIHGRTLRVWWKSKIMYDMLYHYEHHMFPKVPTKHLHTLVKRLDNSEVKQNRQYVF